MKKMGTERNKEMKGIDLNQPIEYCYSSLRYFKEGEYHVDRVCEEDVLLLVYEGVLRFVEDGEYYEIHPGQYHIQKQNSVQRGGEPSSSPKYLYIHFKGKWVEDGTILAPDGQFSCEKMFEMMEKMDDISHNGYSLTECKAVFFQILSTLYQDNRIRGLANQMADYLMKNLQNRVSLETLAKEFSYSRNHIINLFKKEYQMTPMEYLVHKRLERACWILESTADTLEVVAQKSGFSDYSHFYKAFVKNYGKTPGQWRREQLKYPYKR